MYVCIYTHARFPQAPYQPLAKLIVQIARHERSLQRLQSRTPPFWMKHAVFLANCVSIFALVGCRHAEFPALSIPGQLQEVDEVPPAIGLPRNILRQMKQELRSRLVQGEQIISHPCSLTPLTILTTLPLDAPPATTAPVEVAW